MYNRGQSHLLNNILEGSRRMASDSAQGLQREKRHIRRLQGHEPTPRKTANTSVERRKRGLTCSFITYLGISHLNNLDTFKIKTIIQLPIKFKLGSMGQRGKWEGGSEWRGHMYTYG